MPSKAPSLGKVKRQVEGDPISVRFPRALREKAERYAEGRHMKLATAIRTIVGDHLADTELEAHLSPVEIWQRRQAWATAQTLIGGSAREASWDDLRESHAAGLSKLSRPKRR